MTLTSATSTGTTRPPARPAADMDYTLIRAAILYLSSNVAEQPSLERLSAHLGLSPTHCQKLFKRWCGLSPKEFVQAVTVERARELLAGRATVLETAHEVGLSGAGRLHDLFVTHEAMTPGDFRRRGDGLTISYGFHPSPFGDALLMATERGVCGLAFINEDAGEDRTAALTDMTRRWPAARYVEDTPRTAGHARRIFEPDRWRSDDPVRLVMIGSDFDLKVWEALLRIPMGRSVSYSDIAEHLGKPSAARAVGAAVGRNPISFVVPCHRVMRGDGALAGYHWGLTRKRALIGWETGRVANGAAS